MTLKRKLQLGTGLTIALAVAAGALLVAARQQVAQATGETETVRALVKGVFELDLLTSDCLLSDTEQARRQWGIRHGSVTKLLGEARFADAQMAAAAQRLASDLGDMERILARLPRAREGEAGGEVTRALRERMAAQLWAKTQAIMETVLELHQRVQTRLGERLRGATALLSVLLALMVLAVALTAVLVMGAVSRPLQRLEQAAQRIARGEFEVETGVRSQDEIGQLARGFEAMAENLKRSYAELREEIVRRAGAEQRLREERDFSGEVLGLAEMLVVVLDRQGRIVRFNRACERATGYSFAEVEGTPFWDLFLLAEERPEVEALFREMTAGLFPTSHENYWTAREGGRRLIAWSNGAMTDEAGEVAYVIATGIDVTELRAAEVELRRHRDHLEELVEERTRELAAANRQLGEEVRVRQEAELRVRETLEELARSNRELEQFAYVASHDLQEPLRKIVAFGERLETHLGEKMEGEEAEYLERMRNACRRMQTLINDLLAYSRVTTQAQPFAPTDLGQVAREVLSDLEVAIAEAGAEVEVGALPTVEADGLQMRQLLQNLIGNALKFHRPDGVPRVWVEAEARAGETGEAEQWRITVRDNGIGFEQKYADRIFGLFQRLHSREEYAGTGLGLAICRKIVERHGGMITALSRPGEGASFVVVLPMHQEEMRENA